MTEQGLAAFSRLNAASQEEIAAMLAALSEEGQKHLIAAMRTVEHLIGERPAPRVPYVIRPPQPGDMGWVVYRHGLLYNQEYGWDEQFETLVADIVTRFAQDHDPRRERCWIAEQEGENIGSVFLVRQSDEVAKLRLLLVEPKGRGLGIGSRLVGECVRFARQAGYRKMVLWTNSVLLAARRIYEKTGFRLVHEERHRSFGHDLIGETWELDLTGGAPGALPADAAGPAAASGTVAPSS